MKENLEKNIEQPKEEQSINPEKFIIKESPYRKEQASPRFQFSERISQNLKQELIKNIEEFFSNRLNDNVKNAEIFMNYLPEENYYRIAVSIPGEMRNEKEKNEKLEEDDLQPLQNKLREMMSRELGEDFNLDFILKRKGKITKARSMIGKIADKMMQKLGDQRE